MRTSQTLLIALGFTCVSVSGLGALTLTSEDCKYVCVPSICSNVTMLKKCQAECSDFKTETVCPVGAKLESQSKSQTTSNPVPNRAPPLPPKPANLLAEASKPESLTSVNTGVTPAEIQLLEKIANRLIYINKISWDRQIHIIEDNIQNLHKQPQGYNKKYTSETEKYVPRDAFLKKLAQILERVKKTQSTVQEILNKVKDGKEKDLLKAFSDINGDILLTTKNTDEQGNVISQLAGDQNRRIEAFNPSLGAKIKGGVNTLKNRLTGKDK
jgi:hypothetical protein